jgi:hypothetical protein
VRAKILSRKLRKGAPWLKTTLVQCAWAATRNRGSYLHAQFLRLRARRGPNKAILAVAASILTSAYYCAMSFHTANSAKLLESFLRGFWAQSS